MGRRSGGGARRPRRAHAARRAGLGRNSPDLPALLRRPGAGLRRGDRQDMVRRARSGFTGRRRIYRWLSDPCPLLLAASLALLPAGALGNPPASRSASHAARPSAGTQTPPPPAAVVA